MRSGHSRDPELSAVSLPSRKFSPGTSVASRAAVAIAMLVVATVVVHIGRRGYLDAAYPRQPLSWLDCAYFATITLSTTGYGDIVPVTASARLVNTIVIAPIRVIFLIVLIGTTVEVLAERTRLNWRIARWRSRLTGHTVVVGYGTKGRSAIATLREAGHAAAGIVVVDIDPQATGAANRAGLTGVTGDAARREVLADAQLEAAARMVIAVGRDDTAVLIALTARALCPSLSIVAAVREAQNEPLLRECGAEQVVVSADTAGRLLGMTTVDPVVGQVMTALLDRFRGLKLTERVAAAGEIGQPARAAAAGAVAVMRAGQVLPLDDPRAAQLVAGDRIVMLAAGPDAAH